MEDIVSSTKKLLVEEARSSPLLFNDLASMEKYIAESYSGRSLIELLQNADDACATIFYVKMLGPNVYIVANNGKEFTSEDLLSLCRSGASTKHRNSNTIGYRGIGFKSVVNYAQTVHLISGKIKATFSRELTKNFLPNADRVPLIRMPHEFSGKSFTYEYQELLDKGYTTIFIFEAKNLTLLEEIKAFNVDAMLFLHCIKTIKFDKPINAIYTTDRLDVKSGFIVASIFSPGQVSKKWLIKYGEDKVNGNAIAFKYDGEKVIDAEIHESVVHSFMPTQNSLSMRMKLNGDFSTDPSRTRVVMDEASISACEKCADIIADIFKYIWVNKSDPYRVLHVLSEAVPDPLSSIRGKGPNEIIIAKLKEKIRSIVLLPQTDITEIALQPQGIDDVDFETICKKLHILDIGYKYTKTMPDLLCFLESMGLKYMSTEQILKMMREVRCSEMTCITVLKNVIKNERLAISPSVRENIRNAVLFKTSEGLKSLEAMRPDEQIDSIFEGAITEGISSSTDYISFAKRIGLKPNQMTINSTIAPSANCPIPQKAATTVFVKKPLIYKWRTAELNCAAIIETLDSVLHVEDVSKQNMGYDLEAIMVDGSKSYYEVKSVTSLGDPFSISNNEYSSGMQHGDKYYLAVVCQTTQEISLCLIQDPINKLPLNKRITRWDWVCDWYKGELIKLSIN